MKVASTFPFVCFVSIALGCSSSDGGADKSGTVDSGSVADGASPDVGPDLADVAAPVTTPCTALGATFEWQKITPPEFATPSNMETFNLAIDPSDQSVYATAGNKTNGGDGSVGIFKSTDCGGTWKKVSTGKNGKKLETGTSFGLQVDPRHPGTLYDVNGYGNDPTLYKSTNGGVDWEQLAPDVDHVTTSDFVQTFGMDPTDSQHLVLTFHEDCKAPHAPMCFSETKDGGATWREFAGPDDGWHESAGIVVIDAHSWIFEDTNGVWLTVDGGATWDKVLTSYAGFSHGPFYGGHLSPDGTLYIGVANTGVAFSRADPSATPPVPLGKHWTLIDKSPSPTDIIDDGVSLIVDAIWDTGDHPYYLAPLSDHGTWKNIASPSEMKRGGTLHYDPAHKLLYSANGTSGLWRMVTR